MSPAIAQKELLVIFDILPHLVNKNLFECFYYYFTFQNKKASDLNEILFSRFKTNYNNEPEIYRKGTLMYRVSRY